MNRLLAAALAAALLSVTVPPAAEAQSVRQARQQVEATMLVTGHVDIDRQGHVTAHALDQPDKLQPFVTDLIGRAMQTLRFEPVLVDGAPVNARARMGVRLVAMPVGNGDMNLRIASTWFGEEYSGQDRSSVRSSDLRPPRYPMSVIDAGGKGTVYLLVKVGRDGKPEDVVAEQVNLTAIGTARQMELIRTALSKSAVANALRHWTFTPPEIGEDAARPYWVVRVPVDFAFEGDKDAGYGQWSAYHPGERNTPGWAGPTQPGFSPDTLVAGAVAPSSSRFKLVAPIEG